MAFYLVRTLRAALIAVLVFSAVTAPWAAPRADAATGVGTDPFGPQYVVTGSVLLDSTFSGPPSTRQWAATCSACEWVYTDPCVANGPNGVTQRCGITGNPCPAGSMYLRVWFRDGPSMAWDPIALICTKTSKPTPVSDVDALISIRDVPIPRLRPTAQPNGRAFTGLPVWFAANQPTIMQRTVTVLGWDVTITAAPGWAWTFGDGATLQTTDPGGRYPAGGVHHVYRAVGKVRPLVVAQWGAEWRVQDLPARPVVGSLVQTARVNLDIRPTRPILVPTYP